MYKGETPIWFDDDDDGGDNELSVMGDEFPDGAKDAGPTSEPSGSGNGALGTCGCSAVPAGPSGSYTVAGSSSSKDSVFDSGQKKKPPDPPKGETLKATVIPETPDVLMNALIKKVELRHFLAISTAQDIYTMPAPGEPRTLEQALRPKLRCCRKLLDRLMDAQVDWNVLAKRIDLPRLDMDEEGFEEFGNQKSQPSLSPAAKQPHEQFAHNGWLLFRITENHGVWRNCRWFLHAEVLLQF